MTIYKAVKAHCQTDCLNSAQEVKACENQKCHLWPFRFGSNPNRKARQANPGQGRNAKSGRFMPVYNGKIKNISALVEGRKRIKIVVEDAE